MLVSKLEVSDAIVQSVIDWTRLISSIFISSIVLNEDIAYNIYIRQLYQAFADQRPELAQSCTETRV
jgi:hypothetical protein